MYRIPKNLDYAILSNKDIDMGPSCALPCHSCILWEVHSTISPYGECRFISRLYGPVVLERLVKRKVITKAQALDLMLAEGEA